MTNRAGSCPNTKAAMTVITYKPHSVLPFCMATFTKFISICKLLDCKYLAMTCLRFYCNSRFARSYKFQSHLSYSQQLK